MLRIIIFLLFLCSCVACNSLKSIPQPTTEFRGFWVATVVNIDWPKNGGDSIAKQKSDFLKILDFYEDLNFNCAIVQVRTAGDAFYASEYAPWSRFLTGTEGLVSERHQHLLQWMIAETHQRGMEFHAWLNPYRATFDLNIDVLSATHDFFSHPEWMIKYGKKYYYDPGNPAAQQRIVHVIQELITQYPIDGIHFDDYFYPYRIQGEVFQDSTTFDYFRLPGQSLAEWRRSNIDSLIQKSHSIIKSTKPWVQFGVSPFGVWKNKTTDPKGSDTQAGQTTYDDLYADPLLWMEQDWLDYIVPQAYWSMELPVASHRKIVQWWADKTLNTHLYIGNGPYKIRNNSDTAWEDPKEIPRQISFARNIPKVSGNVFFSAKSLMQQPEVTSYLQKKYYRRPALHPANNVVGKDPMRPQVTNIERDSDTVRVSIDRLENVQFVMVYPSGNRKRASYPLKKLIAKLPISDKGQVAIPAKELGRTKHLALIIIDRDRRQSEPILVHLKR